MPVNNIFGFSFRMHNSMFYAIDRIYYNNKTETTVVVWHDGNKTKVQVSPGEWCSIYNAVSAAVMKRRYGSNSAFKSHVEKVLGGYDDNAYMVLARAEACDIYNMSYKEFKAMVNGMLILSVKKKK